MIDVNQERTYPLHHIYFYLTEGCNLACRHCWIAPKYQHGGISYSYLPLDLFKSIIHQAKPLGLTSIKLTGGEPLLHPQIMEIINLAKKEGLRLNLETNGTLCTAEIAEAIAKSNEPFVSISIDGVDAKTHEWVRGVPGCFDAALNGLGNLVDAGLKPQVIMTLMRKNKDQIEEMVELAEKSGAGSVKLNVIQPSSKGEAMHRNGEILSIKELEAIGHHVERVLSKSSKIQIFFDHPLAFCSLGTMFGDGCAGRCTCRILNIIGVLFDGSYALCGIGQNISELVFGHAARDRLEDVWGKSITLREIRKGLPGNLEGICGDCVMKNFCLGNCVAQNYNRSKNLWSPFWYCEEALKEGIFPDSRRIKRIEI